MEQIKKAVQEAQLILANGNQNLTLRTDKAPTWFPVQYERKFHETDLTFEYCIKLYMNIEAGKREKIPQETGRIWFIEFVKRGWTKRMLQTRYEALISTKIFGVEKLDFADWVNAVPVMGMDEVNLLVKQRIDAIIQRGKYLKDKEVVLTEADKQAVDLVLAKEMELGYYNKKNEALETYQQERKRRILKK